MTPSRAYLFMATTKRTKTPTSRRRPILLTIPLPTTLSRPVLSSTRSRNKKQTTTTTTSRLPPPQQQHPAASSSSIKVARTQEKMKEDAITEPPATEQKEEQEENSAHAIAPPTRTRRARDPTEGNNDDSGAVATVSCGECPVLSTSPQGNEYHYDDDSTAAPTTRSGRRRLLVVTVGTGAGNLPPPAATIHPSRHAAATTHDESEICSQSQRDGRRGRIRSAVCLVVIDAAANRSTNPHQYYDHARAYAYEDCIATEHERDPSSQSGIPQHIGIRYRSRIQDSIV